MQKINYYVYAYLRSSDNTPYYIGKGCGKRLYSKYHGVSVPNNKNKIVFLEKNLTNVGACALERRMIKWYGRKDLGTGILLNKTEGGDGNSSPRSDKWKIQHSLKIKNKYNVDPTYRKKVSLASKQRNTDYMSNPKYKELISLSKKGKPNIKIRGRIAPNSISVVTPYGIFDSIQKAADYENVSRDTIIYRIKTDNQKYFKKSHLKDYNDRNSKGFKE